MTKPKVIIVDKTNTPIGLKYRDEIDPKTDIYRCSGVWITNSNDEVLIAQRKRTKSIDPEKWGPAVAGTLEEGETYESNAHKEAEEELGLKNIALTIGPTYYQDSPRKYFSQWFIAKVDKSAEDFSIQEDEVEQVAWISKSALSADVKNHPDKYVRSLPHVIDQLLHSNENLAVNM